MTEPMSRDDQIVKWCLDALNTDGEHHKRWYLEKILASIEGEGVMDSMRYRDGWEPGVAP